jgi:hypothetical protein
MPCDATAMSHAAAGIAFLLLFAASQAVRDAVFGSVFQSVSFFLVILLGFGSGTVVFTAAAGLAARRGFRTLLRRPLRFAALNATTAIAWIAYFYGLKCLEPAVVNTLHAGVGPLAAIAIVGLGAAVANVERACYAGIALSLVALVALVLSGNTGLPPSDPLMATFAVGAVTIGGGMITVSHVLARRFNDEGVSPMIIMGSRFLFTLLVAAAAELLLATSASQPSHGTAASLLMAAFVLIALPSFFLEMGVARSSPLAVNVIRALGPAFVFAAQQLDGRLTFSGATLACIVAFSVFAGLASVLRATAELRRSQPCAQARQLRRHAGHGMEPAHREVAQHKEESEHGELGCGEGRLGLGRRQRLQEGELLERLHHPDEHVEIERQQRRHDIDPAPGPGQPEAVERHQRDGEHYERDGADHQRRCHAANGKHEARDAGEDRRDKEDGGPALQPLRHQEPVDDDEPGGNSDQADDDMQRGERRKRQAQGHGNASSAQTHTSEYRPSPPRPPSAAGNRFRRCNDGILPHGAGAGEAARSCLTHSDDRPSLRDSTAAFCQA